jgi:glutamate formiminotransferase
MPLIAFNVNLATNRLDVAKKVAAAVRFSSGGLPFVKALGLPLHGRGIVQVSMNLTNYEQTPVAAAFDAVKREAARFGVDVLESEIIGLVPAAAVDGTVASSLQLTNFRPDQILENRLL